MHIFMYAELFVLLVALVFQLALGCYILSRNYRSRLVRLVASVCFLVAFWVGGDIFFIGIPPARPDLADIAARIFWLGPLLLSAVFFDFVLEVIRSASWLHRALKYVFYCFSLLLCGLNQIFPRDLSYEEYRFNAYDSMIHAMNSKYMYIPIIMSLVFLYQEYRRSSEKAIHRIAPYFYASLCAAAFPAIFSGLYMFKHIKSPGLSFIGFIIFPLITTGAILRQSSLDIYEAARRDYLLALLRHVLFGISVLFVFLLFHILVGQRTQSIVISAVAILFLAYITAPLALIIEKHLLKPLTAGSDIALWRKLQDHKAMVENAQSMEQVFEALRISMEDGLQVKSFALMRRQEYTNDMIMLTRFSRFDRDVGIGLSFNQAGALINRFMETKGPVIVMKDHSSDDESLRWMREYGFEAAIPIFHGTSLLGLAMIGRKNRGEVISEEEIYMLRKELFDFAGVKFAALKEKEENEARDKVDMIEECAQKWLQDASRIHRLKSPLISILTLTRTLIDEEDVSTIKEAIKDIENDADNGIKEINHLLNSFRGEDLASVSLNDALKESVRRLGDTKRAITLQLTPGLPKLQGYYYGLVDAFENLVQNAVQATKRGGAIRVRSFMKECGHEPLQLAVVIEDEGDGMDTENIEDNFLPGVTSRGKNGSGMGLPIVRKTVGNHKGTISVKSKRGHGTAITVTLPLKLNIEREDGK